MKIGKLFKVTGVPTPPLDAFFLGSDNIEGRKREKKKKTFYWWCRVCTHVGKALFEENLNSVCVYVNDI